MHYQDVIIGKTIEYFLKEKSISKTTLAEKLNVSNATISGLIKGSIRLTLSRFIDVCAAIEVSPIKFFNRMEKTEPQLLITIGKN